MRLFDRAGLNPKKNEKGFTLVEIILAIAIIGILSVVFIPLFASGYIMITKNAETSDYLFANQKATEQKIADGVTTGSSVLTVDFSGMSVSVTGQAITSGEFNLFIPEK